MTETVVSELWSELKRYINMVDRAEAAEIVISVLIDHDSDIDDIRNAFKGDTEIKNALREYASNDKSYDEDLDDTVDDLEEYIDDEDWEN